MKNKMTKIGNSIKKVITTASLMFGLVMMYGMNAYASEPKIISGTKKLAEDATKWLTGIIAVITVAVALWKGFKWQTADEEEKPRAFKGVKNTIIIGVVLTCISGLITVVLGYYK